MIFIFMFWASLHCFFSYIRFECNVWKELFLQNWISEFGHELFVGQTFEQSTLVFSALKISIIKLSDSK